MLPWTTRAPSRTRYKNALPCDDKGALPGKDKDTALSVTARLVACVEDLDAQRGGQDSRHIENVRPLHRGPAEALDALKVV
jgi:hypothetical protein